MQQNILISAPHRRLNILTGEWILVSPHRTARPWQGQVEITPTIHRLRYDPTCYLCPGNERAGGERNPNYTTTFVFDNDYAALLPAINSATRNECNLIVAESERGICRVVCFSPRHDLTLAEMEIRDIRKVVDIWVAQYIELSAIPWVQHVQIFENRGALMGASNPHPHGQIWANQRLPNEPAKELLHQHNYHATQQHCLLCDYLALELEQKERLVISNDHFVALVPYWAVWPFETIVLPRNHHTAIPELTDAERDDLANLLKTLTSLYNQVFHTPFHYSMGFHQPPTDNQSYPYWHLHAHFYPPLLRSAEVRKFMVGYEMLCQPQRDITPEIAANMLRDLLGNI